ncbi:hypothetical protein DERF_002338 [Dermatophagoides farinae]|uniref:Uncharacterized protein n=1 Tax=Dermatophagoides farinae TaxID=6954 RepID=A0A922LDA1_DERFA|nr:hypothetical protein DERF_002338 [Dermatophagoides farinae]
MSTLFQTLRRNNFFLFDVYIVIFLFSYAMEILTINYLVQDKICRIRYNQSKFFCQHIHEDIFNGDEKITKDHILSAAALYNNYKNIIQAIPMFIWSLFFGSFLDRQTGATRMIFAWMNIIGVLTTAFYLINIFNFSIDPYYLLLAGISTCLTGSMATFLTVTHRYIIINTDPEYRTIRFTIFQISLLMAISLGSLLGGNLIHSVSDRGELLRNYDLNMWIGLALQVGSFFMILVIGIDRKVTDPINSSENDEDLDATIVDEIDRSSPVLSGDRESYSSITDTNIESTTTVIKFSLCQHVKCAFSSFFDIENVRQTIRCLTKPRMNQIREQIILLILLLFLQFVNYLGLDSMFLQFSQKVYRFDSKTYANVTAFSKIMPNIILFISSHVLVKCLKWKEGTIFAITFTAALISQILIGTFTNPAVYLAALIIGSIGGLSSIVMKTKIARLIPKDEVGKIFSLISTLESLAPFLGTLIFSTIFSASVSTYPTLIYHAAAAMTLFPNPEYRTIRFTIFQICLLVAMSSGSLLGGNLIHLVSDRGELLRNYDLNMWIVLVLQVFSFIMILVIGIDRKEHPNLSEIHRDVDKTIIDQIDESNPELNSDRNRSYSFNSYTNITNMGKNRLRSHIYYTCRSFFDVGNVRQTFRCLIQPRMNRIREQIMLLILLLFLQFLNSYGMTLDTLELFIK